MPKMATEVKGLGKGKLTCQRCKHVSDKEFADIETLNGWTYVTLTRGDRTWKTYLLDPDCGDKLEAWLVVDAREG